MSLRLPCERCAAVHVTRAMTLSPSGAGYVCWKCEVSAQIAEHEGAPRRAHKRADEIVAAVCVTVALVFLTWLGTMVLGALGHMC